MNFFVGDNFEFPEIDNASSIAIITHERVQGLYAESVRQALCKISSNIKLFTIPEGEQSKTIDNVLSLAKKCFDEGIDRHSLLVALGGGVICDMVGFLASIYMRGVRFINIPTTLLAQVDASIGGKTGVDFENGKNILGTFYEPVYTYVNVTTLKTLGDSDYRSGLAEIVKHAILSGEGDFSYLENNIDKILNRDIDTMRYLIEKNIRFKLAIAEKDMRDACERMKLNLGHTFGHAIESKSGFSITHGEAVSMGICMACDSKAEKNDANRIRVLIENFGLPTKCPYTRDELLDAIRNDKKRNGNRITYILPYSIGDVRICIDEI